MTTDDEKTLQEICGKTHDTFHAVKGIYSFFVTSNPSPFSIRVWNIFLRGWLLSPEVMKAWWGEEKLKVFSCPKCEYWKPYSKHDEELFCPTDGRKLVETERKIDDWDQPWCFHAQQLVLLPTDELLKYYRENKAV